MKNRKLIFSSLLISFVFFMFSCSGGTDNLLDGAVYKSNVNSEFSERVKSELNYSAPASTDVIPSLLIVNGSDIFDMSDEAIKQIARTVQSGNTVIIMNPTYDNIATLGVELGIAMDADKDFYAEVMASEKSFFTALLSIYQDGAKEGFEEYATDTSTTAYKAQAFQAIGIRSKDIYYLHNITEEIPKTSILSEVSGKKNDDGSLSSEYCSLNVDGMDINTEPAGTDTNSSDNTAKIDYSKDIDSAVAGLKKWLNNAGVYSDSSILNADFSSVSELSFDAISSIEEAKKAQRFSKEFFVGGTGNHQAKIQVITNVWAACDIDSQKDYYLVQTTIVCDNQDLGYENRWDIDKWLHYYFDTAWLESSISYKNQTILWEKCSPHNTWGNTTMTTSSGFTLGGNVGLSGKGPSAGISGGFSWSESKQTSIPDISISAKVTSTNHTYWCFNTQDIEPGYSPFSTYCDGAKWIQYNQAVFNTYALYEIPSSYSYGKEDCVQLTHWVNYRKARLHGWWDFPLLRWDYDRCTHDFRGDFFVTKPSNAFNSYIMNVKYPAGTSTSDMAYFDTVLQRMVPNWSNTVKYYGYSGKVDEVAAAYFGNVKKQIRNVEDDLRTRNISGTCEFYIKNVDTGKVVDTLNITF